ncbi:unnamed protein product [Phytophthora lilii]|uniref:Unnamed protein product n=1 Tax=Phytophthora lilii TaxID=2077276 RepID=A0A9W6WX34_9STRA|nr:unnamed protein product [Phytophthora lilii]
MWPRLQYVGDIIRFHKVRIQQYQDRIQGVSFKWARISLADDATLPQGCQLAPKLLNELRLAENFIDLVVRVLHLDDTEEPVRLIVWDGSGNASESDRELVRSLRKSGITVPANGLLKEVIMTSCWPVVHDMGFAEEMLEHWCRFRNLAVGIDEPLPGAPSAPGRREILRFREVTSFVLMPEFAHDVQHRLRLMNGSATTGAPSLVLSQAQGALSGFRRQGPIGSPAEVATVIPDHIQKNVPVTPLQEIISSPQTPRKFHCVARVRSIWPTDIAKICKPKPGGLGDYIYSFALTVEEGNESLNIIVYGKDAVRILELQVLVKVRKH